MIRIYKDNNVKVVTKGAYDTFYKPLGYNIVLEQPVKINSEIKEPVTKIKGNAFTRKNKKEG